MRTHFSSRRRKRPSQLFGETWPSKAVHPGRIQPTGMSAPCTDTVSIHEFKNTFEVTHGC